VLFANQYPEASLKTYPMIVIHPSKTFQEELIQDNSMVDIVQKKLKDLQLRHQIKDSKNPKCYDRGSGIWVLKLQGKGKNSRIILQELVTGQELHQLFIVREYISQRAYEPKWRTRVEPMIERGEYLDHFPLASEEEKRARLHFEERLAPEKQIKKALPRGLKNWLYHFGVDHQFTVYESNAWPLYQADMEKYKSELYTLIRDIVDEMPNLEQEPVEHHHRNIYVATQGGVKIVYEDTKIPVEKYYRVILLHNWAPVGMPSRLEEITKAALQYQPLQKVEDGIYDLSTVTHGAYRGYPALLFRREGRDQWFAIQSNSNKSNLALSSEQVDLLKDFHFPVFINGQAGSGKSEMLMYLFAELFFLRELGEYQGEPIFLTENAELLERSLYDTIEKLRFNSRYSEYKDLPAENIKKYFWTFRNFIISNFIDKEDEVFKVLKDSRFINFYRFKQQYEDSNIPDYFKRRYPAEIAWFVINTFIRGYRLGQEELTPEEFEELPRRDKSFISKPIYEEIFQTVWRSFYKRRLEEEGYWDRLQLVRMVMDKYDDLPEEKKFTVIVCDEAQDFTRVELQFLIKVSKYSEYDLRDAPGVPVTFAGDPFQTVNPTGFNLSQVKRLFTDEIKEKFGIELKHDLTSSLQNNYRSTPEIVNLANLVQYVRYKFLDHSDLTHPQNAKRIETEVLPNLIRLEETDRQDLLDKLQYEVFIAPCDNGGEEDFRVEEGWLPEDIVLKSAARSKGSEYETVVLFKFGDYFVQEFGESFLKRLLGEDNFIKNSISEGNRFRLSFFFNKLYVAITRAKEELHIVDTRAGEEHFWQLLQEHPALLHINDEDWQSVKATSAYDLGGIRQLEPADFQTALKNAIMEMEQGEIHEDPEKMKEATKWYRKIGDPERYEGRILYCEARAFEYAGDWMRAGDRFSQCRSLGLPNSRNPVEEASRCYWIGGYWKKLLDLHGEADRGQQRIRNVVARLMLGREIDVQAIINYGARLQEVITGDPRIRSSIEWEDTFYDQLVDYIRRHIHELAGRWTETAAALDTFTNKSQALNQLIAELYFRDNNYKKAYEKWQEIEFIDHEDYWEAGVKIPGDPNNKVYYLQRLGRPLEILELFQQKRSEFDADSLQVIQEIYYRNSEMKKLLDIQDKYLSDWQHLWTLFSEDPENRRAALFFWNTADVLIQQARTNDKSTIHEAVEVILKRLEEQGKELAIHLNIDYDRDAKKGRREDKNERKRDRLRTLIKSSKFEWFGELIQSLIRFIAHSSLTPQQSTEKTERFIYNYLDNIGADYYKNLDPIEISVCLDRAFMTVKRKQFLYADHHGLLLRDNNLNFFEKSTLEDRWWKIRYDINAREGHPDQDILAELNNTFQKYSRKVKLKKRTFTQIDLAALEALPDYPSVETLRQEIEKKEKLFQEKKEKTALGSKSPTPSGNGETGNQQLLQEMKALGEQNKKLISMIEELQADNKKLQKRNEELQEKLLGLL